MSDTTIRAIDYYIKNLDFDVRQDIFKALDNIGNFKVKCLLEKNEDYPIFRSMGLTDEQISDQLIKATGKFSAVNNIMTDNERYPLFEKPEDTYESSKQYVELLTKQEEKALIEKFGCTWEDYVPKIYKKKLKEPEDDFLEK